MLPSFENCFLHSHSRLLNFEIIKTTFVYNYKYKKPKKFYNVDCYSRETLIASHIHKSIYI